MKLRKTALVCLISIAMVVTSVTPVFACTSMYFGKDTTENGSTFIGRSEDSGWTRYRKFYTVREAADHEAGEMYVSNGTGFTIEYPAHTYRYTMVKDVSMYAPDPATMEEMAQAGTNENGVAVSSSVTLSGLKAGISTVDPMNGDTGLMEEDIPSVVLMKARTAREGAQYLVDIYENIGAGGREMTAIIDATECWVVQALAGHVAVAKRCPSDMVGTTPNITFNVDLGNARDTIATSNIISVAEEAGTLVRDYNGKVLVADSYAAKPRSMSQRLYNCYQYLRGSAYADSIEALGGSYIDYFHEPKTGKYSTFEILRSLAYRGEGGKYYAGNTTGNTTGIGNDNNLETHMFESREGMPKELAVIQWEALGPAEFGCYLPGYNALITETIPENGIGLDTMTFNTENPELNSYRTWYFELYFLCKGRDNKDELQVGGLEARTKYGAGVKEFWEAYQKELIEQQPVIDAQMEEILAYDKKLAEEKATALNMHLQKECLGYIQTMVKELQAFESEPQEGDYVPSCMGELPTYSFDAIGGTGLPAEPIDEEARAEAAEAAQQCIDEVTAALEAGVFTDEAAEEIQAALDDLQAVLADENAPAEAIEEAVAAVEDAIDSVEAKDSYIFFRDRELKAVYNGGPVALTKDDVIVIGTKGDVSFKFYADEAGAEEIAAPTDAGTYYVKAMAAPKKGYKGCETDITKITVDKAAQQITKVTPAKKTIKKKGSFKLSAATVGDGAVTFKKASGNKKITVSAAGKVTVKKGLKKGKTFKVKVKVTKAETPNYNAATATKTISIKIK